MGGEEMHLYKECFMLNFGSIFITIFMCYKEEDRFYQILYIKKIF